MSSVEDVANFLVSEGKGTLGTNLFCYRWGGDALNGILVTSTGGLTPDRFIDGDNHRINITFINILIRNSSMALALQIAEDLIELFETHTITGYVSNKPKKDEPVFEFEEQTINGRICYFGIDLNVRYIKNNI